MAETKVVTQLRISEDLHDKLKTIAQKEKRSLNNLMEYFLTISVDSYLQKAPDIIQVIDNK